VLEGLDRPGVGALDRRPQLDEVLEQLRPGDTLVAWRLDRLGPELKGTRHLKFHQDRDNLCRSAPPNCWVPGFVNAALPA